MCWLRGHECQYERLQIPHFKTLALFVVWRYILVRRKNVFDRSQQIESEKNQWQLLRHERYRRP
jgi:hypothetical protein